MSEQTPPPFRAVERPSVEAITESLLPDRTGTAAAVAKAEREDADAALLRSDLEDREQDRNERLKYANRAYEAFVGWLVFLASIIVVNGLGLGGFELSDKVVIALIGATGASVVTAFLIVANYLFPRPQRHKDRRQD